MGKYQVRYEDDNFKVKSRGTNDGYTTIIDNKDEDCSETYTSIHEGENRDNIVVHTHYDDGSSTHTVFDKAGNLVNQYEEDADRNTKDAMPDDDWESDDDE